MREESITLPKWQYDKMLESYDKAIKELEEAKNSLKKAATFLRQENKKNISI